MELIKEEKIILKSQIDRLVHECDTLHAKIKEEFTLRADSIKVIEKSFEEEKRILNTQLQEVIVEKDSALFKREEMQRKLLSVSQINQELKTTIDILKVLLKYLLIYRNEFHLILLNYPQLPLHLMKPFLLKS